MKRLKYILLCLLIIAGHGIGLADTAIGQDTAMDGVFQKAQEAGIEQAALKELRRKAQSRGLSGSELGKLLAPAIALKKNGLPADHLVQKTLEGLSKGVPASRIGSFVNQLSNSTRQAAAVVDPWSNKPPVKEMINRSAPAEFGQQLRNNMIQATARTISQGVLAQSVEGILSDVSSESVLSNTKPENIVSAIGILPDLPMGEQPKLVRSFVVRALKGGFNASEIQNLPVALNMAQKRSQLPAASIMQGVSNQLKGGVPAAEILQNLFNGNIGGGPPGNIPKGLKDNPGKGRGAGNSGRGNGNGG